MGMVSERTVSYTMFGSLISAETFLTANALGKTNSTMTKTRFSCLASIFEMKDCDERSFEDDPLLWKWQSLRNAMRVGAHVRGKVSRRARP